MGSGVDDIGYEERWIVVDAELLAEADLPPIITQHCDPRRPTTYVPGRGNHRRWEFMLDDHEDAAAFESPEAIGELLRRYVDPSKLNIIRAALYTFHSLVAKNWRDGRVFLAGDAAHQTPPFLGQGMCGGIRDAQNLSWKLAAVARGTAAEEVLDSYQREREPHFRGILERAVECGRIVGVFDQEAAAVRDAEFLAQVAAGDVPFSTYQVPHLAGGLMPLDPIAPAGTLARQGRVATAGNPPELLDEVVGGGAVLLAHSGHVAGSSDADRLREASRDTGVLVWVIRTDADQDQLAFEHIATSHDNGLTAWLAEHAFVLVRPDRYVYDTAQSSDAAVALLNRWSTEALGRVALTPGRA
jgi:3-(3-hydroxy-phenyl)propionate hydroxylase